MLSIADTVKQGTCASIIVYAYFTRAGRCLGFGYGEDNRNEGAGRRKMIITRSC